MAAADPGFARLVRGVAFVNGLVPLGLLVWYAGTDRLGANPVDFVLRSTGTVALVFLVATLAVTPLRRLLGWGWLLKIRRMLGLFSFFYASLHFVTYLWLDQFFVVAEIVKDALTRPFILAGFGAFLLMVPLAVTSTRGWVRRLGGRRWQRLHRRVYAVAVLAVVHYWLLVKADLTRPLWFAAAVGLLLLVRAALWWSRQRGGAPKRTESAAGGP